MNDSDSRRKVVAKGLQMEYLVAGVFQSNGYFVRRAVPLRARVGGVDITDIDVVALKFEMPFRVHFLICDCKNRQRSKPYERVLWARGLGAFVRSSEVYVALPRAAIDLIEFARDGDVHILTQDSLEAHYSAVYKEEDRPYSAASFEGYEALIQAVRGSLQKDRVAAGLWLQARSLYLVNDAYVGLNIAIQSIQACSDMLRVQSATLALRNMWRLIIAEFVSGAAVSLLRISIDSATLVGDSRKRHIVERITYGDMSPKKAEEMWELAREMAFEASRQANPGALPASQIASDIGRIDPPQFAYDVAGLVDRALVSPNVYSEVPQVLDYLLFEQALQNMQFTDREFRGRFQHAASDEILKAARNILVLLRDSAGLDLRLFWPRERSNLPRAEGPGAIDPERGAPGSEDGSDPSVGSERFPF